MYDFSLLIMADGLMVAMLNQDLKKQNMAKDIETTIKKANVILKHRQRT